jgi:hypothetical protein
LEDRLGNDYDYARNDYDYARYGRRTAYPRNFGEGGGGY